MATPVIRGRNRSRAAEPPRSDFWQRRVGSNLTPQYVSSVLADADQGRMDRFADLLDEVRETDLHLQAVLAKREAQVAGAAWEIRPVDQSRPALRAAKYVEEVLGDLPAFSATLAHLQSAVYHGRAVAEIIWRPAGARLVPAAIEPVHPRRVAIGPDWRLYLYDPGEVGSRYALAPGVALDSFVSGKFLVHQPRVRGVYPQREGLGRPLVFASMFKRWAVRDALALAEMAGRKGRLGKYATGRDPKNPSVASPEDIDALADALESWSSASVLVVPDTTEVAFEDPVTGDTIHMPLVTFCNAEISKAVLGGTLTTDPGERGARALGDTQRDDQLMIAKGDAIGVEETLRAGLLAPLVREKYGDGYPVPRIALQVEPKQDANAVMDRLEKFVSVGGKVSQEDARDMLGLPDPKPDAELLAKPTPTPAPQPKQPGEPMGAQKPPADAAADEDT